MKFEEIINDISEKFIRARDSMDIDKMACCLSDQVFHKSPHVSLIYPDNFQNILIGKEAVKNYWILLSQKMSIDISREKSIVLENKKTTTIITTVENGTIMRQTFTVDEYGKIKELICEYSDSLQYK